MVVSFSSLGCGDPFIPVVSYPVLRYETSVASCVGGGGGRGGGGARRTAHGWGGQCMSVACTRAAGARRRRRRRRRRAVSCRAVSCRLVSFRVVTRRRLVLHSAAEENGVSMLREGGHRPRDARAFLSVCGHSVTSPKSTTKRTHHTHKRKNARRSLDSGLPHSL